MKKLFSAALALVCLLAVSCQKMDNLTESDIQGEWIAFATHYYYNGKSIEFDENADGIFALLSDGTSKQIYDPFERIKYFFVFNFAEDGTYTIANDKGGTWYIDGNTCYMTFGNETIPNEYNDGVLDIEWNIYEDITAYQVIKNVEDDSKPSDDAWVGSDGKSHSMREVLSYKKYTDEDEEDSNVAVD